jgi:cyanophycinase
MKRRFLSPVVAAVLLASAAMPIAKQPPTPAVEAQEYGPAKGTLVIVGGGNLNGSGILEKFIELAGGPEKKFVIVPTAGGNKNAQGEVVAYEEPRIIASWQRLGVKNVRMLHTHDAKMADTEDFATILRDANAVWFNGGRQWNIVDSYANTLTYREFHKVLERGGVIGGSSAGATIQGEYLVRGDTSGADVMMTAEPNHQWAFKFLKNTAIDQHINTRNRWDHLIPVIQKFPKFLGIGISEATAIVVKQDRFEVMGAWKVAVHDNTRLYQPWEKPYFVLSSGDVYNMKTRRIEKLGIGAPGPQRGRGGN